MKNPFITIGLMSLFFGTTIKAQDTVHVIAPPPSFHVVEFGARFMPTFSSFDMQTSSGGTIKGEVTLGYGVGALLGINFTNHVGIQGEIIYNSLSQKYKDQDLERKINIRYINLPILLSLNTGKSRPVNLNAVLGAQFGYNVGSSVSGSGSAGTDTLTAVLAVKKSDIGFAYGAGLEFALNTTRTIRLDLGFRGVYGFVNISKPTATTEQNSYYILDHANVDTKSGYIGLTFLF
ncbi:MAG: hypothetical protein A3F72_05815 [Bacteroidetes bacterium RIFCSPLOWO2_12_FULL_35_15]|nr:MAG: hypothetical protein A3F72_05815 [Bacteroidetes bacterium RIFCSPLOWO2_12_FULL_35_15]